VSLDSAIMIGGQGGCYRNSATFDDPTFVEVVLPRDVTPGGGFDFVEASDRSTALKLYAKTQLDKPVQVVMRADIGDPEYQIWVDAANSRKSTLDLLILNKKRTDVGATGFRGPWLVSLTGEPQDIGGTIYSTFELRPTRDTDGNTVVIAFVEAGPALDYLDISWSG
jgi:hypothetical protein